LKARKQELEAERDRAQQVHEELTRDLEKAQEDLAGWNQEDRSRANLVKKPSSWKAGFGNERH
jgi:hypothetical protein